MTRITRLFVYPIKSCARVEVDVATIGATGLLGDRMMLFVGANGKQLTQRGVPKLALIKPEIRRDGVFTLTAPQMPKLFADLSGQEDVEAKVFRHNVRGTFASAQVDEWASEFLGQPVRLLKLLGHGRGSELPEVYRDRFRALTGLKVSPAMSAADGTQLLVISEASVKLLRAIAGRDVEVERFRPNIVVDSFHGPFGEDHLTGFWDGKFEAITLGPCGRCTVPDVNPWTGTRSPDKFVHEALLKLRDGRKVDFDEKGQFMGVGMAINTGIGTKIAVRDVLDASYTPQSSVELSAESDLLLGRLLGAETYSK